MKLDIVPFEAEHAAQMDLRALDVAGLYGTGFEGDRLALGQLYAQKGPAFTGLADGRPVACAGVVLSRPEVGDGWALTGPETPRFALSFCRAFAAYLPVVVRDFDLRRVQALVLESHDVSRHWLTRMGFQEEGLLRQFCGGQDYYMYARVR